MSQEEQGYAEALRRIREAEHTGATSLNLSHLDFLYQLPQELVRLKGLEELDLSWCWSLSGDLSSLAALKSLKVLDLPDSKDLSGDLGPLTGLKSLQTLNLSGCGNLSGDLTPLAGLKSLETLNLSRCERLYGELSPLAGLKSLQTLKLSGCWQLRGDMSPLAELKSLQTLDLSWCRQLGGLDPLAGLKFLQTLNLSGCEQLADLSPLAGLKSLQTVDLSRCGQLSDLSPLAGLKSLQTLDLSRCGQLSDLSPLAGLKSLQTLDLSRCGQLSDLSPLAGLKSLKTLNLFRCGQLSDPSPLAGLRFLQILNLSACEQLTKFGPLELLLPTLRGLYLFACNLKDLPSEVCGESRHENVLAKVRAHYEDLKAGRRSDAEVKVLVLGNGGTGKTQLCRRLRGKPFDASKPTTHGIQLSEKTMELEDFPEPVVRLNLWDFGGQDIYHGSHALFLHGQAIFLLLWTPEMEGSGSYEERGLVFRRRPLSYWLDYIRTFAGTNSSLLIIQSKCDTRDQRRPLPLPPRATHDFPLIREMEVSAKTNLNVGTVLEANIKEAVRDRIDRCPPPPIGEGRAKVRDRLRKMWSDEQVLPIEQRRHRLLERRAFDSLCTEVGGVSNNDALLDFLHQSGVVFYRKRLFKDQIVLDQNWALEAIYSIFHREQCLEELKRLQGRFTRRLLQMLIWSAHTPDEQKLFLGMMESCGLCFKARQLSEGEWEYIAPELMPEWSDARVQEQLQGRLPDDPDSERNARYPFLHEGILRSYLSRIGQHAKDAAVYWKYGCSLYEQKTRSQALIQSSWDDAESESGGGTIQIRAWGQGANGLAEILLQALQNLPVGQAPEIAGTVPLPVHAISSSHVYLEPRLIGPGQVNKLEDLTFEKADQPSAAGLAIPANNVSEPPLNDGSTLVREAIPPANVMPNMTEVVLLIHGIRDFAEWQDMVSTILAELPATEISPLKYGRFDAFRFWFPFWTREAPVKKLLWRIRAARDRVPPPQLSVIAHSFGTYAIGGILKENPDIRLHRLILCGAILPSDFRWDQIRRSVETDIINDCGIRDIWPVLAQSTTFGYGPSGRFGFGTPGVRDRFHDFGHGGFFQEKFVRVFWLPWFRNGEFVKSKAPPPSGARWHLLTVIQLKWLAILLCAVGIVWFALTTVPKGWATLDNFESNHPTLSRPYDATRFNVYPRSTTLRWLPVSGATHYLVEVQWENPTDGLWHILPNYPVSVEDLSYTFDFVGAQPGRWRVAAVNAKNQKTQYSDWWYFRYDK